MSDDDEPHLGIWGFFKAVLPYFKPFRTAVIVIVACMAVDLAYSTVVPIFFQWLIDLAIVPHDGRMLTLLLAALAALAALGTASGIIQDLAYARTGVAVMNAMRLRMFEHLQRLSMGFFARMQVGDVMSRFSTDLASVENALLWYLPSVISGLVGFAISVLILFALEWKLAAISLAGLAVSFRLAKRLEARASDLNYQLKEDLAQVAVSLQENLSAQSVVKGFSLQQRALDQFRGRLDALRDVSRRANWVSYIMQRIPSVGALLMGFAMLGLGAYFVFEQRMTVGELVAFYTLFGNVSSNVNSLTYSFPTLLEGAAGMERVQEILDEPPTVADGADDKPLPPLSKAIELSGITFGYVDDQVNLDGVSLTIAQGASVAFVGASGSGKSTILNLVDRFYDPRSGSVRYDGRDVREVTSRALRDQLGIVFQESILFDTTIRENIRMGRPAATDAEVEDAAKQAEIHDFIMTMPERYDTRVGERGGKLSGGQRQRVAIARALVRRPSVLILDEATSALDPQTEASLNETLRALRKGRTVLSVTHRLAPVVHCDRVFVLDRGKVVEQGSHDELLAVGGFYAKLWSKQAGFTVSADGHTADVAPDRLRAMPFFEGVDAAALEEVAAKLDSTRHPAGAELIREGEAGDKFYVVARGKVEVLKKSLDGHLERVAILDDGDYFGEIALLKGVPRTATVRALTDVTCLTLRRDHFLKLVANQPELRAELDRESQARLDEDAAVAAGAPGVVEES